MRGPVNGKGLRTLRSKETEIKWYWSLGCCNRGPMLLTLEYDLRSLFVYITDNLSSRLFSPPNPHLNELNDDSYHTDSQKIGEGEQECQWSVSQWYRTVCGSFRFTLMLLPLGHNVAAEALLNVWTHTTSFRGRMPGTPPKAFCCLMQGEE